MDIFVIHKKKGQSQSAPFYQGKNYTDIRSPDLCQITITPFRHIFTLKPSKIQKKIIETPPPLVKFD